MKFIPSLKHRRVIENLTADLPEKTGIDYFVCYILLENGENFVISNTPKEFLKSYYKEELYKNDLSYKTETIQDREFYLCDSVKSVTDTFDNQLRERFSMHRLFYLVRKSSTAKLIIGAVNKSSDVGCTLAYAQARVDFEKYCARLLIGTKSILFNYQPNAATHDIFNDNTLLRKVIQNKSDISIGPTEDEMNSLLWISQGKSIEETAIILGKSRSWVNESLRSLRKKLNCVNNTQCVFEAMNRGYLQKYHYMATKITR